MAIPACQEEILRSYEGDTWAAEKLAEKQVYSLNPNPTLYSIKMSILKYESSLYVCLDGGIRQKILQSVHDSAIGVPLWNVGNLPKS